MFLSLRTGKMVINVRQARPSESDDSFVIQITGGLQAGGSYSGLARVHFSC